MHLHCIDTGASGEESPALPLIVLHGLFGSADNWRSHIKQWQSGRRVVAVDLRNHGRSPHVEGMRYAAMASDVIVLLDDLGIERFDLLGHSMGGKVAMTLARSNPARVAHLIVADIAPVAYDHGHDDVFAAMRRVEAGELAIDIGVTVAGAGLAFADAAQHRAGVAADDAGAGLSHRFSPWPRSPRVPGAATPAHG